MKEKGFLIDIVVGTEYERMTIFDPHSRKIVFEGNTANALEFLESEIAKFKTQCEDEGK